MNLPSNPPVKDTVTCYQCEQEVRYLFPDSRCCKCTRCTEEEVVGHAQTYPSQSELDAYGDDYS